MSASVSPRSTILDSLTTTTESEASAEGGDIIILSSDSEVDAHMTGGTMESPIEYWTRVSHRFGAVLAATQADTRIVWSLPATQELDSPEFQFNHCVEVVETRLGQEYLNGFKVGITFIPWDRWANTRFGYRKFGFTELIIMAASESSDAIASLETRLIDKWRRQDRRGNFTGGGACLMPQPCTWGRVCTPRGFPVFSLPSGTWQSLNEKQRACAIVVRAGGTFGLYHL